MNVLQQYPWMAWSGPYGSGLVVRVKQLHALPRVEIVEVKMAAQHKKPANFWPFHTNFDENKT